MRQVRHNTFETNSSSVHTLGIRGEDAFAPINPVFGRFGEFGWGEERLYNVEHRLSYLITAIAQMCSDKSWDKETTFEEDKEKLENYKYFIWTKELVLKYTGHDIMIDWDNIKNQKWYSFGYIDHQSIDSHSIKNENGEEVYIANLLWKFWSENETEFKNNMTDFIFNDKYYLIIDNDN